MWDSLRDEGEPEEYGDEEGAEEEDQIEENVENGE